jgi:hypothetical protein
VGRTLLLEHADGLADLLDNDRRKTLGRLVEQEEARARAQNPADREHLLFAAGKLRALASVVAGDGPALVRLRLRRINCNYAWESSP